MIMTEHAVMLPAESLVILEEEGWGSVIMRSQCEDLVVYLTDYEDGLVPLGDRDPAAGQEWARHMHWDDHTAPVVERAAQEIREQHDELEKVKVEEQQLRAATNAKAAATRRRNAEAKRQRELYPEPKPLSEVKEALRGLSPALLERRGWPSLYERQEAYAELSDASQTFYRIQLQNGLRPFYEKVVVIKYRVAGYE